MAGTTGNKSLSEIELSLLLYVTTLIYWILIPQDLHVI